MYNLMTSNNFVLNFFIWSCQVGYLTKFDQSQNIGF